jgi:hypothetical protein
MAVTCGARFFSTRRRASAARSLRSHLHGGLDAACRSASVRRGVSVTLSAMHEEFDEVG